MNLEKGKARKGANSTRNN